MNLQECRPDYGPAATLERPALSFLAPLPPTQHPPGALESLPSRFGSRLRRYFEKRGIPRDEIDDLVQDVFLRLASRTDLSSPQHLEAYVFKSASNLIHDRHRRRTTHAAELHDLYEEDIHGSAMTTPGPDRLLHGAQRMEQLLNALHELPERTRMVFVLHHLDDVPHQQISVRLGIAVSTIEKHMARASAYLLTRIDR